MGSPAAGSVVLVSFSFSDLSRSKFRPAVVLAPTSHGDFILCQITSNPYSDPSSVELTDESFVEGSLQRVSYARPGKLFTAHENLISGTAGRLIRAGHERVVDAVVQMLREGVR